MVFYQVWGVAVEETAFDTGFAYKLNVALGEVANAAVNQFGAAAGGTFGEVGLFKYEGRVAAAGGVEGDAEAGGAAADNDEVPDFIVGEFVYQRVTILSVDGLHFVADTFVLFRVVSDANVMKQFESSN